MSLTADPSKVGDRPESAPPPPLGRQGPATFLALIGIVWFVVCVEVIARWVTSGEDFTPAPRIGPDVMADWRLIALRVFDAKYYFDDVYNAFVRRVVVGGSDALLWKRVDAGLIDGAVNRAGTLTGALAETLRPVQTGFVRHYALLVLAGAVGIVCYLLWSWAP